MKQIWHKIIPRILGVIVLVAIMYYEIPSTTTLLINIVIVLIAIPVLYFWEKNKQSKDKN